MPAGYQSISTMTKPQSRVFNQLLEQLSAILNPQGVNIQQSPLYQQGSNYLQEILSGSPESTSAFEAPALRQFQEEIIPMLAERFSGLGSGSQQSSAFRQALGSAGAGLSENLAALRSQLRQGAASQALGYAQQPISNLQGFSQLGLGTQAQGYVPKQMPFWQSLLLSLGQGGSSALGQAIGTAGAKKLGL